MSPRRTVLAFALGFSVVIAAIASCATSTEPRVDAPAPPSATTSTVTVSAASVASGSGVTLALQARDSTGANVTTGGATVAFALAGSGTSSGTLGAVTDNSNGTYTATFTGTTAGTARQFSATLNGAAVTTTMPSVTVSPGPASPTTSTVETSTASVQVGLNATLTLRARDAAGNNHTSGGLTVVFTKGAGTSDGTIGSVTDNANGTYAASFAATTSGTARSIGATIGGVAVTSASPTIAVTPAPVGPASPATSVVTINAATLASGTNATITLQAKDASSVNHTTGGATVTFALAGAGTATGTIGAVTDNSNGTYTATLTGVLAGTARNVSATVNGAAVTTTQPSFTVTPGTASPVTSLVTVSNASIVSGNTSTLTLTAKDAAGNSLIAGGLTVAFTKGAGTSDGTIGTVTDNANGTYSATLTGTTAGTARAITATINSAAVTTTAPTITVSPGALSLPQSLVSVSLENVEVAGTSTLTLSTKDAAGNTLAVGGSTVLFTQTAGANPSTGTIGSVTDNNNGTYTATFTGTAAGTPLSIGATVGGNAVTSPKPSVIVYVKGITLTTTSITANATAGQAGSAQLIGVFANGSQTAAGLQASISYTTPSIAACQSSNWLGTPTFDFTTANPFSILTLNPTALNLGIYSCTATVTISSSTPGVASQQFTVSLAVARTTVAQTAVNLVFMGLNSNQNQEQIMVPDAKILITNGGRGIMTGLHATVTNQQSNSVDTTWIINSDLSWENDVAPADSNNRTAPRTLVVHARVRPQNATAVVHVSAAGMPTIDIPLNVFFNINLELVTNPRGLTFNAFAGGTNVAKQVVAFNQNRLVTQNDGDSLRTYTVDAGTLPSWLSANVSPLTKTGMDTAATITFTANPTGLLADSVYTANVTVRAEICEKDFLDPICNPTGSFDTFVMPVKFFIERGLVVPVANATIFAAAGTATVDRDIAITNGGSTTISGLSANVGGAAWLSASFIGGTTAPTTLRLTANPTGFARGTVLNTTVTVSSTTPGAPSRSFPVTFRVY